MKKKLMIIATLLIGLASCNLDINEDPNSPSGVTPSMIFPSAQNYIAGVVGNSMYNYAGFFAQYYDQMPEAQQYDALIEYNFTMSSQIIDLAYSQLYAGALTDLEEVKNGDVSAADKFAVAVLRAFSFQLLVDNTDQTPYSEALQGSTNSMPKWDNGQSVYEGVLNEMATAEAALDNSGMTCNDLLLDKSVDQWIGFANALRLRMYLRFIDAGVDVPGYTEKVKTLVQNNKFFSGDVKFDVFADEASKYNPWYNQNKISLATNHVASYPIVSYLKATNDPRMAYSFVGTKASKGAEYAGEIPGSKNDFKGVRFNKDFSGLNYYPTKPVYFFTQSELQFLIAETFVRFIKDDAKAKMAYENAIIADFKARNMEGQADKMYGSAGSVKWASATTEERKLELIYMQKWVALCYMDHMEAWSEIRRTDCPKLSSSTAQEIDGNPAAYTAGELIAPWTNALGNGKMVKRMFPSYSASQLNANTPKGTKATDPVWWDKK